MGTVIAKTRENFLSFAKPDVGEAEIQRVSQVISSGWLTTGSVVHEFEKEFASYLGVKHAIAVNSATAAMHLSLEAIGLKSGDEVITTTFTFAATAEVIRYFDAKPVLIDIDPYTFNIDVDQISNVLTNRTKAIIPVHVAGLSAEMDTIITIAHRHGLKVIEDAAHALPTKYKGKLIGTISDLTAYSFYATKTLATGEGGMIVTNNDDWAERCRVMSLHGISKDAWKRYTSEGNWYYEIVAPGYKYNLTDMAAAIGLVQLGKLESMTHRRQAIARRYDEIFKSHPALEIAPTLPDSTHPYHLYILRLNLDNLTIDRNTFIEHLKSLNIGVSVHWMPLHMHPYYKQMYGYKEDDYPHAFAQYQRIISLPIYSAMSDEDVNDVINSVIRIADYFSK